MANSSKQPYIAFFEEYFNYMDDLNPEQYFQFMTLIRNLRWKGIDTLPENVTDKDVRLAWRSIRPSIAKSRRNASDFQNRNNSMEPNKDFEEEKPVDVPQESEKPVEQPKNDQEMTIECKPEITQPQISSDMGVHISNMIQDPDVLTEWGNTKDESKATMKYIVKYNLVGKIDQSQLTRILKQYIKQTA